MQYLTYYLAAINVVLYALMGLDKLFAKLQKRRIPLKRSERRQNDEPGKRGCQADCSAQTAARG